jgi:hypothetical protein
MTEDEQRSIGLQTALVQHRMIRRGKTGSVNLGELADRAARGYLHNRLHAGRTIPGSSRQPRALVAPRELQT